MTEEQKINVKVAECCGWQFVPMRNVRLPGDEKHWHCEEAYAIDPLGERKDESDIPDFQNSRDAMAAALETLREQDWPLFIVKLAELTRADLFLRDGADFTRKMMCATPKQLAIALLKAKGISI